MISFTDNFQLILLLVAGIVWVLGQVAGAAKQFRASTRARMERQERQRRLEIEPRPPSLTMTEVEPEQTLVPVPEKKPAPPPVRPPRPIKRPPRVTRTRPAPGPVVPRAAKPVRAKLRAFDVRGRMRNRAQLREAIVLREVLGPPIALRGRRQR